MSISGVRPGFDVLEVRDLRAGYGRVPILQGIHLSLAGGEAVGILGHNGMGKTTLVKALIGILRPTAGRIVFQGQDITAAAPFERVRRGLGYVPQGREIFPGLSVLDNLRMGIAGGGRSETDVLDGIFQRFPLLRSMRERLGGALSGGEQQILAIARCLCGEPRLILMDEPTEGIQPSIIDLIQDTLIELRQSRRQSLIVVEQNLDFIAGLCERVLTINRGQIVQELTREQLNDPSLVSEYTGTSY
jgi:branched-chain amino acid transport system ATP-binding protein